MRDNDKIIYYTPKDIMNMLQLGRTTVNKLLNSGELPATKIGGSWRVNSTDFAKWQNEIKGKVLYI